MPVTLPCSLTAICRFSLITYGCMKLMKLTVPIVKNDAYKNVSALRRVTPVCSQMGPSRFTLT